MVDLRLVREIRRLIPGFLWTIVADVSHSSSRTARPFSYASSTRSRAPKKLAWLYGMRIFSTPDLILMAGISGGLEQLLEFLNRQTGVLYDTTHRVRIDRVGPRDRQNTRPVRHNDVLTLSYDTESCLLGRSNRICDAVFPAVSASLGGYVKLRGLQPHLLRPSLRRQPNTPEWHQQYSRALPAPCPLATGSRAIQGTRH